MRATHNGSHASARCLLCRYAKVDLKIHPSTGENRGPENEETLVDGDYVLLYGVDHTPLKYIVGDAGLER